MNPRTTWWLLALAAVLFAFIMLVERRLTNNVGPPQPAPRLVAIRALEVTNIQMRITNRLALKVEKTNDLWNLTVPLSYPAQREKIESLLQTIENLSSRKHISLAELTAQKRTIAEFGLDVPRVSLTLLEGRRRTEILFGSKTPVGDQVYVQLLASPDIYEVDADLFDRLPREANDWRDPALLTLAGLLLDRLEVRAPGRGFTIVLDTTNSVFRLTKPTPARADRPKIDAFLRKLAVSRVERFETDGPLVDLEGYGLQPPAAELALGKGTNDLVVVQFGKSPTNDATQVYARRLSQNNIVLVSKSLLDAVLTPYTELRDRHLVTFQEPVVDLIETLGPESYAVMRVNSNTWAVAEAKPFQADAGLVREFLDRLSRLEGNVEKDVVTDYDTYGLEQPLWKFLLKTTVTNATGLTNRLVTELDLGARQDNKVFVRRPDESSVYSLPVEAVQGLPFASWQLRDRRVFRFTTNQVAGVTIRMNGYERKLVRGATGDWLLAPGSQGIIAPLAVEEMMLRLGQLRALVWVDHGDQNREAYGFTDSGYKLTFELKNGDKPEILVLEFGKRAPSLAPYALTTLSGQTWVFEFPYALYYDLLRFLGNPPLPKAGAGQ